MSSCEKYQTAVDASKTYRWLLANSLLSFIISPLTCSFTPKFRFSPHYFVAHHYYSYITLSLSIVPPSTDKCVNINIISRTWAAAPFPLFKSIVIPDTSVCT